MVRRLHNRRVTMVTLPNGDYYTHFAVALKSGEADELRQGGHVDSVINYILRDRVRYWVLVLKGETLDAVIGLCGELRAREQQRKGRRRVSVRGGKVRPSVA